MSSCHNSYLAYFDFKLLLSVFNLHYNQTCGLNYENFQENLEWFQSRGYASQGETKHTSRIWGKEASTLYCMVSFSSASNKPSIILSIISLSRLFLLQRYRFSNVFYVNNVNLHFTLMEKGKLGKCLWAKWFYIHLFAILFYENFIFYSEINTTLMLKGSLKTDSYPKAKITENKGNFVSKCHFYDINCIWGTLGLFRSVSEISLLKPTLCSGFVN